MVHRLSAANILLLVPLAGLGPIDLPGHIFPFATRVHFAP